MDKNIHESLSILIDLLQPSNEDYSPAQYTQLLNRFLAFDEEMSEIACLYKDCSKKMYAMAKSQLPMGIVVQAVAKEETSNTPVDIPPPSVQPECSEPSVLIDVNPPEPELVLEQSAKPTGNDRRVQSGFVINAISFVFRRLEQEIEIE